jgi:replicative DNA helicase
MKKPSKKLQTNTINMHAHSGGSEHAVMRQLVSVFSGMLDRVYASNDSDAMHLIDEAQVKLFNIAESLKHEDRGLIDIKSMLPGVAHHIEQLHSSDGHCYLSGTPTGFTDLDNMTSGLQGGDLIVVAGRPAIGKTSLSLNIAQHVAINTGMPVAVFSMKIASKQLVMRMMCSRSDLDLYQIQTGPLDDNDLDKLNFALDELNKAPIFIDETAGLSASDILARAWRLHRRCGKLGLIVIDSLQSLAGVLGREGSERVTGILDATRLLKSLAKALDVAVIVTSQLNRALEKRSDKHPILADLGESGAIEQNVDLILFIYRDEVYYPDSLDKGLAEIALVKNRSGRIGRFRLKFKQNTFFENYF